MFLWNLLDLKRVRWEGTEALAPGKHTLEYDFRYDGLGFATLALNNISGIGRPGTGTLKVDGKLISTQRLDRTVPLTLPWDETFDIGSATGTLVDDHDYQVPFKFTGKIEKLTVALDRPKLTPEECRSTFDLISAPCAVKMSQKSSLPQSLHSVQLVLTGNTESSAASGS